MNRITSRFVLLIATAAVLPLVIYGAVSVNSLRSGTTGSVIDGNRKVAEQVAAQVELYIRSSTRVLQSIGTELNAVALTPWQQERILKDYVIQFPEFREITVFDAARRPVVTSALRTTRLAVPEAAGQRPDRPYLSPIKVDDDLLPTTTIAVGIPQSDGPPRWILGEIAVEELWRTVDRIRIGASGYALVIGEDFRLIAHGNPDEKRDIAANDRKRDGEDVAFARQFRNGGSPSTEYPDRNQQPMIAVAAAMKDPAWTVIVEQSKAEALATARSIERQLFAAILLALTGTIILGWVWGRSFIQRIFALTRVTRSIAEGKLETRVAISGQDEIRELGDAFNSMADRLVELQEDVRKQ